MIELFLLLLMIIIFCYINIYCAMCLLICLIIKMHDFNLINLEKILLKLRISNCVNVQIDDKLNILSNNKLTFKSKALYLKGKAKSKIEKMFFSSLANCNNKKQIDILIECYYNMVKSSCCELYFAGFCISLFCLIIRIFYNYYIDKSFNIILLFISIIILSYEIVKLLNIYIDNGNSFYRFYIIFYRKLSYLPPLIAYNETLKKNKNKIFRHLLNDINEKRFIKFNFDEEKNEFCYVLYQVCYTNSLYNEKKLNELYHLSLKKSSSFLNIFYKNILNILYMILIGVILI